MFYGEKILSIVEDGMGQVAVNYWTMVDVDVDVVDLRAQADASMLASNNNVNYTIYSNF